jgi:uncharacterized membrane protein
MASRIRALTNQRKRVLKRASERHHTSPESNAMPRFPGKPTQTGSLSGLLDSIPGLWGSAIVGGSLAAFSLYKMITGLKKREAGTSTLTGGLSVVGGSLMYRGIAGLMANNRVTLAGRETKSPDASVEHNEGIKIEETVVVDRTPQELYEYWRNVENLPSIMRHLKSVVAIDSTHSHWKVTGPIGTSVEWDAEIYTDEPGSMISWRSMPGAEVGNAGSVHFADLGDGHGTTITVMLKYDPPAGKLGALVAELLGEDPAKQIRHDLRRFKKIMESGDGFGYQQDGQLNHWSTNG